MTATTTAPAPARVEPDYGGWRSRRSPGLFGLGTAGTYALFGSGVPLLLAVGRRDYLLVGVIISALLALVVLVALRDEHGRSLLQRIAARLGWARARSLGAHLYRSGPLSRIPWGTFQLPGLLAASRLVEYRDAYGRPFALVHVPSSGQTTVVLASEPDGASLVDPEELDQRVADWGAWLAALGEEPDVVAASMTIEAAPDTGARLRREVTTNTDPDAHPVAQAMLAEVVQSYPLGSASVRAWAALTLTATPRHSTHARTLDEVARDLAARLPGLTGSLAHTGAGAARPVGAEELCELVRMAYDPDAAEALDTARVERQAGALEDDPGLRWHDVGPVDAVEGRDYYVHDGAVSVTWVMSTPPRQYVYAQVLARLLAPHPGITRKRVTMLYAVADPSRSAKLAEADQRGADFMTTASKRPGARAEHAKATADQAAKEEAKGAALVDFGMLVTGTVTPPPTHVRASDAETWRSPDEQLALRLDSARSLVRNLGTTARVLLRPAHGFQAAAFAAALPLGLNLPRYVPATSSIGDAL